MTGPPSYPDTGSTSQAAGPPPPVRPRWRTATIVILVIAALAVMVILHLTGTPSARAPMASPATGETARR